VRGIDDGPISFLTLEQRGFPRLSPGHFPVVPVDVPPRNRAVAQNNNGMGIQTTPPTIPTFHKKA
jgi:hypothetical protein